VAIECSIVGRLAPHGEIGPAVADIGEIGAAEPFANGRELGASGQVVVSVGGDNRVEQVEMLRHRRCRLGIGAGRQYQHSPTRLLRPQIRQHIGIVGKKRGIERGRGREFLLQPSLAVPQCEQRPDQRDGVPQ
jgi:hypothetical protein